MTQTTNTAATTLEQVNAMPAATWGWLKMNQTKLELSDELAAAPTEAVEVEGLDEQFTGVADAFEAAMDAIAEREFDLEHEGGEYDNGLIFSDDAVEQCTGEAEYACLTFNTYKSMSFDYNADDGLYYANQYGDKYIDENTGEQVSFSRDRLNEFLDVAEEGIKVLLAAQKDVLGIE